MVIEKIIHRYYCTDCGSSWETTQENSLPANCVECPKCYKEPIEQEKYIVIT
jgi:predicted Zn-ribbon and HTH transcriptional regulator